ALPGRRRSCETARKGRPTFRQVRNSERGVEGNPRRRAGAFAPCLLSRPGSSMSDERALLAAICAEPEEDTPRLAYADWLDEHGGPPEQARAAFIRTQIERFRLPDEDHGPAVAD